MKLQDRHKGKVQKKNNCWQSQNWEETLLQRQYQAENAVGNQINQKSRPKIRTKSFKRFKDLKMTSKNKLKAYKIVDDLIDLYQSFYFLITYCDATVFFSELSSPN